MEDQASAWREVHSLCDSLGLYGAIKESCSGKNRVLYFIKRLHASTQPEKAEQAETSANTASAEIGAKLLKEWVDLEFSPSGLPDEQYGSLLRRTDFFIEHQLRT